MGDLPSYLPAVALACMNLLIGWGVWSMRAALKVELAGVDARLRLAEQVIQSLPHPREISDLAAQVTALAREIAKLPQPRELSDLVAQVASLTKEIGGVRDLVVRNEQTTITIHRYLMEKGR